MTHRGCGKLPPRLAVCEPRACLLGGNEWVTHLEPQTECTGTSTGTNQQTKRKGHQPWHIAHRTKAITRPPISEGSCQNPDTRGDNSLVQIAQSFVQYFLRHMLCCLLSLQSADSTTVPACKLQRCRPKTGGKRLIYGFALMQTASRAWNIPPSPSQPAAQHNQSQPY